METIQIRLTKEQIEALELLSMKGLYGNRCEAIREAVRQLLERYEKKSVIKGKKKTKRR